MTFSSSKQLHQHFANKATGYATNVAHTITPMFQSTPQVSQCSPAVPADVAHVSSDHHSCFQSMIEGQSPIQVASTSTAFTTQQQLPHPTGIPMDIAQTPSTTTTTSSRSRGSGANNALLIRRLSDKDKERQLTRR